MSQSQSPSPTPVNSPKATEYQPASPTLQMAGATSQDKDFAGTSDNRHQPAGMNEYERRSLRLQLVGLFVQGIALFGAIGSIWLLYAQVMEQTRATNAQYDLLDASVYQDLMSKQLDLNKLFIEKPKLYGHVFGKRNPKEKIPPDALSAAYYHLDFFQLVFSQRTRLPALRDENSPDWNSWKNTMASAFESSPLLCDQLARSKHMYGPDFVKYVFSKNLWCHQLAN